MKYVLLCLLLAATPAARAQSSEVPAPFKGANIILVHTTDSTGVAVRTMARALLQAGLEPDRYDAQVGYLTTKGKLFGMILPAVYVYKVLATTEPGGTLLTITGEFTQQLAPMHSITSPMFWTPGNPEGKRCFALVEPVAQAYPKGRVGYLQSLALKPVMH